MFGPEYLTLGAYIGDGEIYCPKCGDECKMSHEDSISVAQVEADFPEGISCGRCGDVIVETPEVESDEAEDEEDQ